MDKIKDIEFSIEEIKDVLEEKIFYKTNKILEEIKYVTNVEEINNNSWVVYIFIDKKDNKILKIGKDTTLEHKRCKKIHYSIDGAQSTLAKDLYNNYVIFKEKSILKNLRDEEKSVLNDLEQKISEQNNKIGTIPLEANKVKRLKDNNEIREYFDRVRKIVRTWMKNKENIEMHAIVIPVQSKIFILNFLESYFQLKYEPKFEGFKKQNLEE